MIKNKKRFFLSLILFVISITLNFPFPHQEPYGETVASAFNIPVQSANGFHYVGIVSLVFFITSLFLLMKSVNKFQGRAVLLAILITIFVPSIIVAAFQKTVATGVYAISYEREWSSCEFEKVDESTLKGECELPFENHSSNDVQFSIEFYEFYYSKHDLPMLSLMNEGAPYEVVLRGKEHKIIKIESYIDVSTLENHIESGNATGVNIFIKSGEKTRKL